MSGVRCCGSEKGIEVSVDEPRGKVLPVYFVADESGSMAPNVADLNEGLISLLDAMQDDSMAASKIRFCVVGFNDTARCYLEPSDLRDVEDMPMLGSSGSTSYAAAFRELRGRIPEDVARLKGEGYDVHRPAVFFLSDGAPNRGDGWKRALGDLTAEEFRERPNLLAFGIGRADPEVIRRVATAPEYGFVTAQGVDTGTAIAEFSQALTRSVVASGGSLGAGDALLQVEKPEGFISLAVDTL